MIGAPDRSLPPFDLTGPLPSGTVALEASAGTGKTFTIAGLVTRWVAETTLRLPELLVVTFTRAATAELRDRVRRRLVQAADHLDAVMAGATPTSDDPVLACIADTDTDGMTRRRRRLERAVAEIDVATISTIHGFCQHVLDGLGVASDLDREAELVEDAFDLVEEVVDDLLVTTYLDDGDRPRVDRDALVDLGRIVVANPTTSLAPRSTDDPVAGLRLHFAERIRAEVARRARRRRVLSYDDLLTRLERTLRDPVRGGAARAALRSRYRVTLIDEFQDTDPVQWNIVARAFADPPSPGSRRQDPEQHRALVLIGDPKQAIYAFRGADVYAYLDAAARTERRQTLGTSWRADAGLLQAFSTLFDGATFGDPDIPFRPVDHAPGHDAPRLVDAPDATPLRLRLVPRHPDLGLWDDKPTASRVRELIARDVAADVSTLLGASPTLIGRDRAGAETSRRPLAPRDIAVLVRTNAESTLVQEALLAVGVPAVVGGAESVFATAAATDWRRLLDALERPAATTRVRALALSAWIGWTADEVASRPERDWDDLHADVHRWAEILRDRGVAAMHRTVLLQRAVRPRLLATTGGERAVADLEHIGELLHATATAEHLGTAALASWLRERIADADDDQADDRLRRLETDDEAVQVLTVHRSKGLEFAVVHCPFLWSSSTAVRGGAPVFHDDARRRHVDVGGEQHAGYDDSRRRAEHEARGEELRLLYVALTRARHQVVAWYAPAGRPEWSGLGRLLLCRDDRGGAVPDREAPVPTDDEARAAADALARRSGGTIGVATVPAGPTATPWRPATHAVPALDRARFDRTLDDLWRRTSYSALTRLDDGAGSIGSEQPETVKDDEADLTAPVGATSSPTEPTVPLPLAEMPGGTHVGTFVHRVLEHADFAADDLEAELETAVAAELTRRRLRIDPDMVVSGLRAALTTSLGPSAGGITLRALTRADRRDEVDFELPLNVRGRPATVGDLAAVLRTALPDGDPLAHYPDHLPDVLLDRPLRGFLGGSIDLVARRTGADGQPVFHVADYKTNRLGTWGEPLTAGDYHPDLLAAAMIHGHYPVQAVLYAVALHRMLRWRLPGYRPDRHLGSVLYLFVRGMAGPGTPTAAGRPHGVFAWDLPADVVVAVSDLLHGATP